MKSLRDKVVAVTGAGSGMGREIALLCAERGAIVALADYNRAGAEETAGKIREAGGKASVHQVDVSKQADVQRFVRETLEQHKVVDVVFNNAGIIPKFERFEKSNYDVMERMLAVNLWGVVYGSKEFLPHLLQRPEAALVNTSSAAGLLGYLGLSPYVASKFAVRGFTEALRMEYWDSTVTVSVVHPGAIATNIVQNSPFMSQQDKSQSQDQGNGKAPKMTTAKEAARAIVDGMQKGKKRIIVGFDAWIQDVLARFFPVAHTKLFYGKMKSLLGIV